MGHCSVWHVTRGSKASTAGGWRAATATAELALLVELVRVCTVTLGLMTALCGGPAESSTTCLPQGTVAGIQLACTRKVSLTA